MINMKQLAIIFFIFCGVFQEANAFFPFDTSVEEPGKPGVPRFYKSKIGKSTCSAYFPVENPQFDITYSEDKSVVTTWDSLIGTHSFAMIHVQLSEPFTDSLERQNVLVSYLDFLKTNFNVTGSAGYGFGHTLSSDPQTQGLIDFWQDDEGTEYSVKAWVNANFITIYFVYGKGEYEYYTVKDLFFNGLRYE
jgi:hypothetical protein